MNPYNKEGNYLTSFSGEVIFGQRLGFLESRSDVKGIMADIRFKIQYASIVGLLGTNKQTNKRTAAVSALTNPHFFSQVGQIPWLDRFMAKNPLLDMLTATHPIVKFTVDQMNARRTINSKDAEEKSKTQKDFLSRSFDAQQKSPDIVTDRIVRMWNIDNVFAGSDTTAVALRSVSRSNILVILYLCWLLIPPLAGILLPHAKSTRDGKARR